jgi:hypothetical protein
MFFLKGDITIFSSSKNVGMMAFNWDRWVTSTKSKGLDESGNSRLLKASS